VIFTCFVPVETGMNTLQYCASHHASQIFT